MGEDQTQAAQNPTQNMASGLEPALRDACGGRLGKIRWFSADWQSGGASTGYSEYQCDDGARDVVVKFPVGPLEYRFTKDLGVRDAPTPRVVDGGMELGGYDMAWLVMERVRGKTLKGNPDTKTVREVLHAAVEFHARAQELRPVPLEREIVPWADLLETARSHVHDNPILHQQIWNEQIKRVQRMSDSLVTRWRSRPINTWCHGDLHPGNAMHREEGSAWGDEGIVLLDLGHVHPGHWVEDAVYFER
ncbi:MAG: aminoglycoside phosphotransferase family protein, partial [Planctomycetota bacterium]